jgi:hypothetical protein
MFLVSSVRSVLSAAIVGFQSREVRPGVVPVGVVLDLALLAFAAFNGTVGAMVFSLLATEVPAERRSATLNLVDLPLFAAGIIGPAIGAGVAAAAGVDGPFLLGAAVFLVAAVVVALRVRPRAAAAPAVPPAAG